MFSIIVFLVSLIAADLPYVESVGLAASLSKTTVENPQSNATDRSSCKPQSRNLSVDVRLEWTGHQGRVYNAYVTNNRARRCIAVVRVVDVRGRCSQSTVRIPAGATVRVAAYYKFRPTVSVVSAHYK